MKVHQWFYSTSIAAIFAASTILSPVAMAADWAGPYIGGHLGYGTSDFQGDDRGDDVAEYEPDGLAFGFQGGYNWQSNRFVYGLQADGTIAPWKDSGLSGNNNNKNWTGQVEWLASIRARAGYALSNRGLFYVTGGAAFVGANFETRIGNSKFGNGNFEDVGFVVGFGGDLKYNPNVSFGLEGLYYSFDDKQTTDFDGKAANQEIEDLFIVRLNASWHL